MASDAAASGSGPSTEEIQAQLKARLIESGEYQKMLGILAARLEEAGWQDKLKGAANEKILSEKSSTGKAPTVAALTKELEGSGLDAVPKDAREEIEKMLEAFVEKNVE